MPINNYRAVEQTLSSGTLIRQDFTHCVRFAMFDTDDDDWRYATHGGTVFIVNYKSQFFGITCKHVPQDFNWKQFAITNAKFGETVAGLSAIYYASSPTGAAEQSDVLDIMIIKFSEDVDAAFFKDNAYVIDEGTVCRSKKNDNLLINGNLKNESVIDDFTIAPVFGLIEVRDQGSTSNDPALRSAIGKFENPEFKNITGLSGCPVFNITQGKLCGMSVRGGTNDGEATIWFVELYDINQLLKSIVEGTTNTSYEKIITSPVASEGEE